jgi:BT1 family
VDGNPRLTYAFPAMQGARVYLSRLSDAYGLSFLSLLCSVYLGLKGPVYTMITSGQLPYFKSIGITGERFQSYGVVASTPWAMKAVIGIVSDSLPILGESAAELPFRCGVQPLNDTFERQ